MYCTVFSQNILYNIRVSEGCFLDTYVSDSEYTVCVCLQNIPLLEYNLKKTPLRDPHKMFVQYLEELSVPYWYRY
jgi:hypothetical protein